MKKTNSKIQREIRPLQEIHREYSSLCMKAGDLRHKVKAIPEELLRLEHRLEELDKEAAIASANQPKPTEGSAS